MSSDFSPELRRELLDDFYAECDELLTAMREELAQLDSAVSGSAPESKLIESLYRSTHSIKGNSAIVGLRSAEELAHGMEDLLRAMSKRLVPVSHELVDALLAGTQRLEKIVVAHRLKKRLPDTADLLAQFKGSFPPAKTDAVTAFPAPPISTAAAVEDPVAVARAKGLNIFHVSFVPSPALDQRGVNITAVRQRLNSIGEIISANPVVREKGSISFEFVAGVREIPADFTAWVADGIIFKP